MEVKTSNKNTTCNAGADTPDYICDGNGEYRSLKTGKLISFKEMMKSRAIKEVAKG